MLAKKQQTLNLPREKEHRVWSKDILRQKVGVDQTIEMYLTKDANYQINRDTIAIYEFQKEPLLGKYKSVIFDCQKGIVLCQNSTRSLFTAFGQKCLLAGLEFQRDFASKLNLTSRNIIATGRLAYFSLRSYNSGSIDWVSLHQMIGFRAINISSVVFKTVPYGEISYIFAYYDCSHYVVDQISNSLVYNHILCELLIAHFEQSLGWQVQRPKGESLIDQPEYFHPHDPYNDLAIKPLLLELQDKRQQRYGRCLADYLELPLLTEFHRAVRKVTQRRDTLF